MCSLDPPAPAAVPGLGARTIGARAIGAKAIALLILVVVLPRLVHVWAPIAGWHAWRQADTAAIARNFYRSGLDILHPAVDWAGATPGYVECELPLYPFLVALLYRVFGLAVVWGRLLSIAFSAVTAVYLALVVLPYAGRRVAALSAAAWALFPVNGYIGAAFMPESLALLASVAAVHHLDRWTRNDREADRLLSAGWAAVAIAVKLPYAFIGLPLAYLAWTRHGWGFLRRPGFWLYAAVALLPPALWYAHAHNLKAITGLSFGIWEAGTGKWGNLDLLGSPRFYSRLLLSRMIERHLTYPGLLLLILGVFALRGRVRLGLFGAWLAGIAVYFLVVARGNEVHDYYQLPALEPLALFVGAGLERCGSARGRWRKPAAWVLIALFITASGHRHFALLRREIAGAYIEAAGARMQAIVPADARVIACSRGDPTLLYHADRRGWCAAAEQCGDEGWIADKVALGASYVIGLRADFGGEEGRLRLEALRLRFPAALWGPEVFALALAAPRPE